MSQRSPITPWILVILWVAVIFVLGGAGFEHDQTSRIIRPLLRRLFPDQSPGTLEGLHDAIRKLAHVGEYALAAVLVYRAFVRSLSAPSWRRLALPTLAIVAAVATLDENRQAGLAHRTGSARDVLFDLAGGLLGLCAAPWIVRTSETKGRDDE